jgi:hypothetical protein
MRPRWRSTSPDPDIAQGSAETKIARIDQLGIELYEGIRHNYATTGYGKVPSSAYQTDKDKPVGLSF